MDKKQEAIDHYIKMIGWAKTQPQEGRPRSSIMEEQIQENWYSQYCSYCNRYLFCKYCELKEICGDNGEIGFWYAMDSTTNWKDWIEYAEKILEFIKIEG